MHVSGEAVEDEVVDAVVTASRAMIAVTVRSLSGLAEDITIAQYRTLVVLASRGPQKLADLAVLLGVTPPTPFARILATSLSIGTGGSGGVFGPGMVIGAFTGLATWRLLALFAPAVGNSPLPFIVIGMMALFGGIARAPLANILMVAQMTGNIEIIGPAMVAVAIATLIVRRFDDSIYRSQLRSRADSAASQLESGLTLLPVLPVSGAAEPPRVVLTAGDAAREALAALIGAGGQWVTITDDRRHVTGILTAGAVVRAYRGAVQEASVTSTLAT